MPVVPPIPASSPVTLSPLYGLSSQGEAGAGRIGAAVCTEICSVHPEADRAPQALARLWDDEDLDNLSLLCEEAHAQGSLAGVELFHPGPHVDGSLSREVPGAPTQLPSDAYPLTYPREMSLGDIEQVQGFYVVAAARAQAAGFDIVYVYGAHGYLPMQFLSPFYNRRSDDYGGCLENRGPFLAETLELFPAEVVGRCAVAARISVDSGERGGVPADEALSFIALADPLVDLWDVNVSAIADRGGTWHRRGSRQPAGSSSGLTSPGSDQETDRWRRQAHQPGRDGRHPPQRSARHHRRGDPSIADPFLPRKIELGDYDEVREGIGCNICVTRAVGTGRIACTQNATAGRSTAGAGIPSTSSEPATPTGLC